MPAPARTLRGSESPACPPHACPGTAAAPLQWRRLYTQSHARARPLASHDMTCIAATSRYPLAAAPVQQPHGPQPASAAGVGLGNEQGPPTARNYYYPSQPPSPPYQVPTARCTAERQRRRRQRGPASYCSRSAAPLGRQRPCLLCSRQLHGVVPAGGRTPRGRQARSPLVPALPAPPPRCCYSYYYSKHHCAATAGCCCACTASGRAGGRGACGAAAAGGSSTTWSQPGRRSPRCAHSSKKRPLPVGSIVSIVV